MAPSTNVARPSVGLCEPSIIVIFLSLPSTSHLESNDEILQFPVLHRGNLLIYSRPPKTAALGLAKLQQYWKAAVNVVIHNLEKTYSGLENQRRCGEEVINGEAAFGGGGGGGDCIIIRDILFFLTKYATTALY